MFCAFLAAVKLYWEGDFRLCEVWLLYTVQWTEKGLVFTLKNKFMNFCCIIYLSPEERASMFLQVVGTHVPDTIP
jgi:hypothetical protein